MWPERTHFALYDCLTSLAICLNWSQNSERRGQVQPRTSEPLTVPSLLPASRVTAFTICLAPTFFALSVKCVPCLSVGSITGRGLAVAMYWSRARAWCKSKNSLLSNNLALQSAAIQKSMQPQVPQCSYHLAFCRPSSSPSYSSSLKVLVQCP